jgi:Ca2+-binding EF-hand superfamily protein
MDDKNINHKCELNTVQNYKENFQGYTEDQPKRNYYGNLRHFFANPRKDLFAKENMISEIRKNQTSFTGGPKANTLKNSYLMHIKKSLMLIGTVVAQKKFKLKEAYQKLDEDANGLVNVIRFKYVLAEKIGIDQYEVEKIIHLLDKNGSRMVDYGIFLAWVKDPESVDGYFENFFKGGALYL